MVIWRACTISRLRVFLQELVVRNIKILTYHFLDRINGDLLAGRFYKIPEYFLGQFEVDLSFVQ